MSGGDERKSGAASEASSSDGADRTEPLRRRPSDVQGRRAGPDHGVDFESGDVIAGRFRVERFLGSSRAATSYLCVDRDEGGERVVKMLAVEIADGDFPDVRRLARRASRVEHPGVGRVLGVGRTDEGEVFAATDYVAGTPLARAMTGARDGGDRGGLAAALAVVDPLVDALEAVHHELAHGVLTPYNVYLDADGRPVIANLAVGRIAASVLRRQGGGPYIDSFYVAPEVAVDPGALSPSADVFSAAMITGDILSEQALPADREAAVDTAVEAARAESETLGRAIERGLAFEPAQRPESVRAFRAPFESLCEEQLRGRDGAPRIGEHQLGSAADGEEEDTEGQGAGQTRARFMVRRDGLDYGPFTRDDVVEQLYEEEIDEETEVRDRVTGWSGPLGRADLFEREVEAFLDWRQERELERAERREEIKRRAKSGGRVVLTASVAVAAAIFGVLVYFYTNRPAPESLPFDEAVAQLDYSFEPPPEEFDRVSVDRDQLARIFARGRPGSTEASAASTGGGGSEPTAPTSESTTRPKSAQTVVDMEASGGGADGSGRLTDEAINEVIMSDFSDLRECIQEKLREDPSFSGTEVKFYIRPSGATGGVRLTAASIRDEPVGRCVVREFKTMTFPSHRGVNNRGVTFPLKIRRE